MQHDALMKVSLNGVEDAAWGLLAGAVRQARDPLHTASLATNDAHGPSQRTVVLRDVDRTTRTIACHSDRRSGKIAAVEQHGRSAWLFYDRERRLQLRLAGPTRVHFKDDYADTRWSASRPGSRACYNTQDGPGVALPSPPEAPSPPEDNTNARARANFCVIACEVDFVDWLVLSRAGHRRAQLIWNGQSFEPRWVHP